MPKSTIAKDLGMHHQTFSKLLDNPEGFTFKDTLPIAALLEVEEMVLITLIYRQCEADRKSKKKK